MNYYEANQILDKVKEGTPYPQKIINQALELTGDLDEPWVFDGSTYQRPPLPYQGTATPFFGPRGDTDADRQPAAGG